MKLYNKGGRSLIIAKEQVINGGTYKAHDNKEERPYFDPGKTIEVKDEYGEKLLGMYPDFLMRMDEKAEAKKTKAKAKVKAKGKR